MAQIVELIITYDRVGDGTEKNPTRLCAELYTKSGKLVARHDSVTGDSWFYPDEIETFGGEVHKIFNK